MLISCSSATVASRKEAAPQCDTVAREGGRDPKGDVKGCGHQSRKSYAPLTQLVLIALRKCSHIPFNPINPETVVNTSGSIYGVFWRWSIAGVRTHVCSS